MTLLLRLLRFPRAVAKTPLTSTASWNSRAEIRMMATVINPPRDPNSLSNYNNWVSTHVTANFDVLFDQRKLTGNVVHRFKSITHSDSKEILLDTNHLEIGDVKINGNSSEWELLPSYGPYGKALKISLQNGAELDEIVEADVCFPFAREWSGLGLLTLFTYCI